MSGTTRLVPTTFPQKLTAYGMNALKAYGLGSTTTAVSTLFVNIADILVAGESSQFGRLVGDYMKDGMTKEQAISAAGFEVLAKQPILEGVKGGAVAAVMSIPGTASAIRAGQTLGGRAAVADEQGAFRTVRAMEAGPEAQAKAVKTNIANGLATLEQANARLRQSSGIANSEAFKTETANNALMDYLTGKGSAQTAADAFRSIANEAIASGKLTAQEVAALKGALGQAKAYVDAMALAGDNGIGVSGRNTIYGIPIIDGKVGGKIPLDEYKVIRESSVINPDADSMTLGQYGDGGANSYIARAGKDSTYFDMGNKWNTVKQKYNLSNKEMFDYFNKPALDDAINSGKTIRFSHNPLDYSGSFLADEWAHIKHILNLKDADLIFKGGFWYVG